MTLKNVKNTNNQYTIYVYYVDHNYRSMIRLKIESDLKENAENILKEKYNMNMSDFLRDKIYELIKEKISKGAISWKII